MPMTLKSKSSMSDTTYLKLQDQIGYCFQNPNLLKQALTHPSSTAEENSDNERMEFLGDAILNLSVSQCLYERYPLWNEGELTQVKSVVVSTMALARAGEALGLRLFGMFGKGLPIHEPLPPSVYANIFEAVCAAVYLDGGLNAARSFVTQTLDAEINAVAENGSEPNHKSLLQQIAQKNNGITPHYKLVCSTGPDHGKIFETTAVIGDRQFPSGHGRSKKFAEQAAARRALEVLEAEKAFCMEELQTRRNGKGSKNGKKAYSKI